MRPPTPSLPSIHFLPPLICHPPLSLLFTPFSPCLSLFFPSAKHKGLPLTNHVSLMLSCSCSIFAHLPSPKTNMLWKWGKTIIMGETQGESDTLNPSLPLTAIEAGASGTPVPQIICILSFLQAAHDVAYCLVSRWLSERRGASWEGGMKRWGVGGNLPVCEDVYGRNEIRREIVYPMCQVVQRRFSLCSFIMCVCVFCFKMKHLGCLLNHLHYCLHSPLLSLKELQTPLHHHYHGNRKCSAHIVS